VNLGGNSTRKFEAPTQKSDPPQTHSKSNLTFLDAIGRFISIPWPVFAKNLEDERQLKNDWLMHHLEKIIFLFIKLQQALQSDSLNYYFTLSLIVILDTFVHSSRFKGIIFKRKMTLLNF
jgi:hypothetical protein